ncbi:WD40 repeat-like protein [Auricularia subglabra TFB-10046 SS5]|nr:WD40 repeat-like protein [Auricularia subglabra TFB-10046 SS5]
MSSKKTPKPPKSRPQSTFNKAVPEGAARHRHLSAFSPSGNEFALVSLALDKHRLRVFDVSTSRIVAEHTFDDARVTCLAWSSLPDEDEPSPAKKRKKHTDGESSTLNPPAAYAIALGLSSGAVCLFSAAHGRVLRTLSHATSSSAVTAVSGADGTVWASSNDGTLRSWNPTSGESLGSWKRQRPSCRLSVRPDSDELLECANDARLITFDDDDGPEDLCRLSGHASDIVDVAWGQSPSTRLLTCADGDRVVHLWDIPDSGEGALLVTMPLDSDVLSVSISGEQVLLAVTASGRAYLAPLPTKLSKKKTATIEPQSTISIVVKGLGEGNIAAASFRSEQAGRICVVRIAGGVRPVFETIRYTNDDGEYVADVVVKQSDVGLATTQDSAMHANKRYREHTTLAVQSGVAPGADAAADSAVLDGHLDAELAELSLGQRMGLDRHADLDEDDIVQEGLERTLEGRRLHAHKIPKASGSLARTLVQALHAGDSQLLDTVLRYGGDIRIVQATVRRLPPQLAVPFLTSVTERMARRKQDAAAASAQRGLSLLNWVRAVLVVHGAHLLTMPDLVARLAALHATLTTRATMQDRLLALSGRLELVLAQAALRGEPVSGEAKPKKDDPNKPETRYVEGESDEDPIEEDEDGSDAGSEEVVELGEDDDDDDDDLPSGSGEEDDEDDEEDEDESGSDTGARRANGLVDDEAEEEWDDESESDEE